MKRSNAVMFLIAAWFAAAVLAGLSGSFNNAGAPQVALTVWSLTALGLIVLWTVRPVRNWATQVNLASVVSLHLTRFVGIWFLILCRNNELSCAFARPAGIGDIAVATGALLLLVGRAAQRRTVASRLLVGVWNTLGLLDILLVVFNALRVGLRDWLAMAPLREFPLSLLPMFLVPLIIISHILIYIRLARQPS